jgi:hypothetical protein
MNHMNAQNIISHRMFVAALSHDEFEAVHKHGAGASSPATSNRGPRASKAVTPESPGAAAQQLFLLTEFAEFQPGQA